MKTFGIRVDEDTGETIGPFEAHRCDAQHHPVQGVLATKKLWWVTGPIDYCEDCCAKMLGVAEVLGVVCKVEDIPIPPELLNQEPRRTFNLGKE